jgi:hypothetical protein
MSILECQSNWLARAYVGTGGLKRWLIFEFPFTVACLMGIDAFIRVKRQVLHGPLQPKGKAA